MNLKKYITYNAFDYNNPNILNGYIGSSGLFQTYSANGMVCVPIIQGEKYEISGIIRISSSISIRWGTFSAIPTNNVQSIRTGTFAQDEVQEITAETSENYIAIMFCGDSDYNSYGSVESAYATNCLNLHVDTTQWSDLAPKRYENGAFVDTTNNPEKYSGGSWS